MRYLNKIIFINSASVKYAEMELYGNVHLIGTQGVGKSTLLRAILFFYNADKSKLGIPKQKSRFDDYYFEYQDSYIIYEVVIDDISFCILAYKINGKAVFRFFDSEYRKDFFIDENNRAFENWGKIRDTLGKDIHYTKKITSYDEYRKILYGDNQGLKSEFRKYALIESAQYQNIPRTIQNVLLNSNLEARFIKDTIINSISDDEVIIDVLNYSKNHLKNFETKINDIEIWFKKNNKDQIIIRNQADEVINNNNFFNFLKIEKQELAKNLSSRINYIERERPDLLINHDNEKNTLEGFLKEKNNLKNLHQSAEQNIISKIDFFEEKLKESKEKSVEYENKNIKEIIKKVVKKEALISEKKSKKDERQLITSDFANISQKYDALILQINNQKDKFENEKNVEISRAENKFTSQKSDFNKSYNKLFEQIKATNKDEKEQTEGELKQLTSDENSAKRDRAELKYKVFFNDEIKNCKSLDKKFRSKIYKTETLINNNKNETTSIQKEVESVRKEIERKADIKIKKERAKEQGFLVEITNIKSKLKQGNSSFYGWLNDTIPNWENTIGKVVDEENVLFNTNLNPKKISKNDATFFGIELNLNVIDKRVKTVEEFNQEIIELDNKITDIKNIITKIIENKNNDLGDLNIKSLKKIKPLKDIILKNEYIKQQNEKKLKENKSILEGLEVKSETEKLNVLQKIKDNLKTISSKEYSLIDKLKQIKESIDREIKEKDIEKNGKIKYVKELKNDEIKNIKYFISENNINSSNRVKELKAQQNSELNNKGADTKRLKIIDELLIKINYDLDFVKDNETLVIEYQKDKREIFDKVDQFKNDKLFFEKKKKILVDEQRVERDNLNVKLNQQHQKVYSVNTKINKFNEDLENFNKFKLKDIFPSIEYCFSSEINVFSKTAVSIIDNLNENHYESVNKLRKLQQSINLFTGNFDEYNIFSFKTKFNTDDDYFNFATELKEFIEENKINEFEKLVNESFTDIIQLIGKETGDLQSKEAEINKIIKKINTDFTNKNFVEAIKKMEMRTKKSSNPVVRLLIQIKEFNDENSYILGSRDLFTSSDTNHKNRQAIELLKQLVKEIDNNKYENLTLSESFDLEFRIVENDNDSGWVEKLSNVGSTGTDILVKAMINISLLNVFKEYASKKIKDFTLHCMMDEIGQLHPNNQKGILRFANERNIFLINGSPISQNAIDYSYTYKLSKEQLKTNNKKYATKIIRLIKKV
jgi:hypothetical protein